MPFSDGPLHLKKLTAPHVKHLLKVHCVRGWSLWYPRFRLQQYANMVQQIDLAITREGGSTALAVPDLTKCSHLRGLNVQDQDTTAMVEYVEEWMAVTSALNSDSLSLLLHLPILLGYNHSSRIWDKSSVS